jgi:hypothetical protein
MRTLGFKRTGIVAAAAVAAAVVSGGGVAMATTSSAPATISGCYKTGSSPTALEWVKTTASCPKGYTKITWNQQGVQGPAGAKGATGPAGVATGLTAIAPYGSTPISLSTSSVTVLQTPEVAVAGTYYVSAMVQLGSSDDDEVYCGLIGISSSQPTTTTFPSGGGIQTLPVVGTLSLTKGSTIQIGCVINAGSASAEFINGNVNAILVGNSTGTVGGTGTPPSSSHATLPKLQPARVS